MAGPVATLLEKTVDSSGLSTVATAAANVASGLIVGFSITYDSGATITSVTDNAGNTYSKKGATLSSGGNGLTDIYIAESVTGNAALVTTIAASGSMYPTIVRFTIPSGVNYVAAAEAVIDPDVSAPISLTSGTPSVADDLILCAEAGYSFTTGTSNFGAGSTLLADEGNNGLYWTGGLGQANATGTSGFTFTWSATSGPSSGPSLKTVGFRASGGGFTSRLSLLGVG